MLPKKNRLNLSPKKGNRFFGEKVFGEDFNVIFKKSNIFRAAIVVSKKVAPRAVDRNRIRRLFQEALRGKTLEGEFIFFVKRNLKDLKEQEINEKIQRVIAKFNI